MLFAVTLVADPLPDPKPIIAADELRTAAAEVPVVKIDLSLPEKEEDASDSLEKRFFNQPEEHRYSGVTTADWSKKWDLFASSLVSKAKQTGFDWQSLAKCLHALNKGQNRQTMMSPWNANWNILPDTPEDKNEGLKKENEKKYQEALKDKEENPEKYYNNSLAIIPVGAYLARYSKGECWIIVCKWEYFSKEESSPSMLGHIMVWALDVKSASIVAYVSCD
jgi:hypothetical protein